MSQWVQVDCGLPQHRKFKRLGRALGETDEARLVGGLVLFWAAVRQFSPDGNLAGWDDEDVSAYMGRTSTDSPSIIETMIECGLIDRDGEGTLTVHGWEDLSGKHLKDAARKRLERQQSKDKAAQSTDIPGRPRTSTPRARTRTDRQAGQTDKNTLDHDQPSANGNGTTADRDDLTWVDLFDSWFWREYPRKVGKPAALRAWKAVKPQSQETGDAMARGLARWRERWTEPQFIPHPSTWLNQRRWEDQP